MKHETTIRTNPMMEMENSPISVGMSAPVSRIVSGMRDGFMIIGMQFSTISTIPMIFSAVFNFLIFLPPNRYSAGMVSENSDCVKKCRHQLVIFAIEIIKHLFYNICKDQARASVRGKGECCG